MLPAQFSDVIRNGHLDIDKRAYRESANIFAGMGPPVIYRYTITGYHLGSEERTNDNARFFTFDVFDDVRGEPIRQQDHDRHMGQEADGIDRAISTYRCRELDSVWLQHDILADLRTRIAYIGPRCSNFMGNHFRASQFRAHLIAQHLPLDEFYDNMAIANRDILFKRRLEEPTFDVLSDFITDTFAEFLNFFSEEHTQWRWAIPSPDMPICMYQDRIYDLCEHPKHDNMKQKCEILIPYMEKKCTKVLDNYNILI